MTMWQERKIMAEQKKLKRKTMTKKQMLKRIEDIKVLMYVRASKQGLLKFDKNQIRKWYKELQELEEEVAKK